MERGVFVALEGLDGSGTTTQSDRLAEVLRGRGHRVLQTHQPSARSLGKLARAMLRGEGPCRDPRVHALLFAADRLDHVAQDIEPALARGEIVLCDRYVVSSWVYQSLDCPADWVEAINRHAPWPDVTFLLELSASEATARVHARTPESQREIFETETIQRKVEAAYAEVASRDLPGVLRIDGSTSIEVVTEALVRHLEACGL